MKCTTDWKRMYEESSKECERLEKELAELKASLPKVRADAVLSILDTEYTCEAPNGDTAWSSRDIEKHAAKLEQGNE